MGFARCISTRRQGHPCSGFTANQPEYIGASISSGCIRLTNEDVIDLYSRVKMGTIVVVPSRTAAIRFTCRWRCKAAATRFSSRPLLAAVDAHQKRRSRAFRWRRCLRPPARQYLTSPRLTWLDPTSPNPLRRVGFGGDFAWRFIRPLSRQQRRTAAGVPHVPLADFVIVVPPIRSRWIWSSCSRLSGSSTVNRAHTECSTLADFARHRAVGKRDRLAVGELQRGRRRVGATVPTAGRRPRLWPRHSNSRNYRDR